MTDVHVLNMPSRRFWCLEKQINRIMAQEDLRQLNIHRATSNKEAMEEVVERLSMEIGDTARVEINPFVKPEPGVAEKLRQAMQG